MVAGTTIVRSLRTERTNRDVIEDFLIFYLNLVFSASDGVFLTSDGHRAGVLESARGTGKVAPRRLRGGNGALVGPAYEVLRTSKRRNEVLRM